MESLDDFLLNLSNLYYKFRYMTLETQRVIFLYILFAFAVILAFLLLFPATNIFNTQILWSALILVIVLILFLFYKTYEEGYYYYSGPSGIQNQYQRPMTNPYGEQTVREIFQDTMRQMETSGKKTNYGNDVFQSSSQYGLQQQTPYYGSQATPYYGNQSTPYFGPQSAIPLGSQVYPSSQVLGSQTRGRQRDGFDNMEQSFGKTNDDMRNWPSLGGIAYPTARDGYSNGRDAYSLARDVSPNRSPYRLQARTESVPSRRGYNDLSYPSDVGRKPSLLFSQNDRAQNVPFGQSRRDLSASPSLTPMRLPSNSPLRGNPKSPNLRASISSPLRKVYSGSPYTYDNYPESGHQETLENLNQERETEARRILALLGIHTSTLNKYKENCHQWFCKYLVELISKANDENLRDLNSKLGSFGRMLDEYEILAYRREEGGILDNLQPWRTPVGNSFYKPVTLDELINYEYSLQRGGPFWNLTVQTKTDEALKIHNELRTLIKKRIYLENYFEISGFRTTDTRRHIMWRLYLLKENLHKNLQYTFSDITLKYPTDTQILANILFKYLSLDVLRDLGKNYPHMKRNIVFDKRSDPSNLRQCETSYPIAFEVYDIRNEQDVYFKQSNIDGYEPHYDLYCGKELWTVLPGPDNLFYALFLFLYVLKIRKNKIFGSEPNQELTNLIDTIVPTI